MATLRCDQARCMQQACLAKPSRFWTCQQRRRALHSFQHGRRRGQRQAKAQAVARATAAEFDYAVIGGGIIGLCVALELLKHASQPSVALLERRLPCSGATGAGNYSLSSTTMFLIPHRSKCMHSLCAAELFTVTVSVHGRRMWSKQKAMDSIMLPAITEATCMHGACSSGCGCNACMMPAFLTGQGYIWLAHRQPNSPGWAIAQRSKQLWESMVDTAQKPAGNVHHHKRSGSKADIEWQVKSQCTHAPSADVIVTSL